MRFDEVTKHDPELGRDALHAFSLTVDADEFVSIVGPSGCGKTTALRIVAGLDSATSGVVQLGGVDITGLDTRERDVGLVTQQNQLVPRMSAGRTIQFPLEVRPSQGPLGRTRPDHRDRPGGLPAKVAEEAAAFGIGDLIGRRPSTLSEGQRRLVQLVRAIIASPSTLLLDEPFGFLEDQVRIKLRTEILRVHRERRLTTIMATANQQDAMVMSDRIAVMSAGELVQLDTPTELYDRPCTTEVAAFFGEPAMNLLPAVVRVDATGRWLDLPGRAIRMWLPALDAMHGLPVTVGVRPEHIELGAPQTEALTAEVVTTEHVGYAAAIRMRTVAGLPLVATGPGARPRVGTVLDVGFRSDRIHLFDAVTGTAIHHPSP